MILIDKKGCPLEVRAYALEDFPRLDRMYEQFTLKAKYQGLPPFKKEVRQNWLKRLTENGYNFLALMCEEVVGHVVILPDFDKGDAEYLIFVSQNHQRRGVGNILTYAALEKARVLNLKTVWLTVDAYNFRAVRLYQKVGFSTCENYDAAIERMLALDLTKEADSRCPQSIISDSINDGAGDEPEWKGRRSEELPIHAVETIH